METLLQQSEKKSGLNKMMVGAFIIGTIAVLAALGFLLTRPTTKQLENQVLENAFRAGSPEFELYTKRISITTDNDRTVWSPTAMGKIVMSLRGTIRNITGKTLTGLEIKASVVDSVQKPVKEKTLLVIPRQAEKLETGKTLDIQVSIEGFEKSDDRAQIRWQVTAIKVE
jgi:hypothetical protein